MAKKLSNKTIAIGAAGVGLLWLLSKKKQDATPPPDATKGTQPNPATTKGFSVTWE